MRLIVAHIINRTNSPLLVLTIVYHWEFSSLCTDRVQGWARYLSTQQPAVLAEWLCWWGPKVHHCRQVHCVSKMPFHLTDQFECRPSLTLHLYSPIKCQGMFCHCPFSSPPPPTNPIRLIKGPNPKRHLYMSSGGAAWPTEFGKIPTSAVLSLCLHSI